MKRTLTRLTLAFALAGAPPATTIAADGVYFGVSGGYVEYEDAEEQIDGALADQGLTPVGGLSIDDNDSGKKAYIGYWFNKYVGLEGGIIDLGEVRASGTVTDGATNYTATGTVASDGFTASVLGRVPLHPRFSVFGKAGAYQWDTDFDLGNFSRSDDGTSGLLGIGGEFELGRAGPLWHLRAEWEHFFDVGEKDTTGRSDIDYVSIGIVAYH